jgi:hypothetical protein
VHWGHKLMGPKEEEEEDTSAPPLLQVIR